MPRFAFRLPSIGSRTTRVSPPPSPNTRSPSSSETRVNPAPSFAERASSRAHDGRLRRRVDGGRLVAALAHPHTWLPLVPRRQVGERGRDGLRGLAANLQPVRHSSNGEKRSPLASLG